ncbi:MAG: hypothetical protein M1825_004116 [Sarcosagium campestre]|nr:MAG: hypothetical protein M1825_004116 [Sarcosagium campestre]
MPRQPKDLDSSLAGLDISASKKSTETAPTTPPAQKRQTVADSWEDEVSSGEDTETEGGGKGRKSSRPGIPNPPPPTPVSPLSPSVQRDVTAAESFSAWSAVCDGPSSPPQGASTTHAGASAASRPEKTDAVAKRMIAGALGVRAPKRTEEQKEYERAIREKEAKRKNQEREAQKRVQEAAERAKARIWDE